MYAIDRPSTVRGRRFDFLIKRKYYTPNKSVPKPGDVFVIHYENKKLFYVRYYKKLDKIHVRYEIVPIVYVNKRYAKEYPFFTNRYIIEDSVINEKNSKIR